MELKYFAVCTPGLEPYTAGELEGLGLPVDQGFPRPGAVGNLGGLDGGGWGIPFRGPLPDLYRANLLLRTASRVLVRFGDFQAASFPELRRKAGNLPWEKFIRPGAPVTLRVACHKSRLYHQGAVAERVAGAIEDRLGQIPPVLPGNEEGESGPQMILVRLVNNEVTISLDFHRAPAASPGIPTGHRQSPLAGNPGRRDAPGFRLGLRIPLDRSLLRFGDHSDRSGPDRLEAAARKEKGLCLYELAGI